MKRRAVRKPFCPEDCVIDISYEQYSQPSDPVNVNISVDGICYDASNIRRMRQQGRFMVQAADWLEDQICRGKVRCL